MTHRHKQVEDERKRREQIALRWYWFLTGAGLGGMVLVWYIFILRGA